MFFSDHTYHSHHIQQDHFTQFDDRRYSGIKYIPTIPHKPDSFEPYLPLHYHHETNKGNWGIDHHRYGTSGDKFINSKHNYYLPPKPDTSNHWGLYGNSNKFHSYEYGTFGHKQGYGYWGFDTDGYKNNWKPSNYLPLPRPEEDKYFPLLPPEPSGVPVYLPKPIKPQYDNFILPTEPRNPDRFGVRDGMNTFFPHYLHGNFCVL